MADACESGAGTTFVTFTIKHMARENPMLTASTEDQNHTPLDKIKLLQDQLSRLTILDNPQEIRDICTTIIDLKKHLQKVPFAPPKQ